MTIPKLTTATQLALELNKINDQLADIQRTFDRPTPNSELCVIYVKAELLKQALERNSDACRDSNLMIRTQYQDLSALAETTLEKLDQLKIQQMRPRASL